MDPHDPEVKGISEVEHDGMPQAGHDEQLEHADEGDTSSKED